MPVPVTNAKVNWENAKIKHIKDKIFKKKRTEQIKQCLDLLEHVRGCYYWRECREGESCRRLKQVWVHYRSCPAKLTGQQCGICQQFQGLCEIHYIHSESKSDCKLRCKKEPFAMKKRSDKIGNGENCQQSPTDEILTHIPEMNIQPIATQKDEQSAVKAKFLKPFYKRNKSLVRSKLKSLLNKSHLERNPAALTKQEKYEKGQEKVIRVQAKVLILTA